MADLITLSQTWSRDPGLVLQLREALNAYPVTPKSQAAQVREDMRQIAAQQVAPYVGLPVADVVSADWFNVECSLGEMDGEGGNSVWIQFGASANTGFTVASLAQVTPEPGRVS